jgi:general secretion pathway protein K
MSRLISHQHGSALISALFIMTLVAIAATAMSVRLQTDIERTNLTVVGDRVYLASQVIPFWAISKLSTNKQYTVADKQGKIARYPSSLQHIDPSLVIDGSLYDLQSRFNINNLVDNKNNFLFLALLEQSIPRLTVTNRIKLLMAIKQWITPYRLGLGNDEWITYYTKQTPAYYPSQQLLQSISELRLIRGIDAKTYQSLQHAITALPEVTPININTAPLSLLTLVGKGLDDTQLKMILKARGKKGIQNSASLMKLLQKLAMLEGQVTIESQYFLAVAKVTHDALTLTRFSILKRSKDKNGKFKVQLINDSLNAL